MSWFPFSNLFCSAQTITPIDVEFKVHIAIDFGTDGCGLAYAYNNKVHIHSRWGTQKYAHEVKPQNHIILDTSDHCVHFGSNAKFHYSGVESFIRQQWKLFERFKMSLYEDQMKRYKVDHKNEEKVEIATYLTAVDGQYSNAEAVFVAAFKHVAKQAKNALNAITAFTTTQMQFEDKDIQWIITVPSIWNDNAKHKMKMWAEKAGLINKYIKNQCKIVYEPDCAALALQHFIHHQENTFNPMICNPTDDPEIYDDDEKNDDGIFKNGEKYILVDAGGGTVDVVCHQILGKYGVKEVLPPSGGKWGSCYIDDQYILQLEFIFSKQWIDEFRAKQPSVFMVVVNHFQKAKETFFIDEDNKDDKDNLTKTHDVELPIEFLDFIHLKLRIRVRGQCSECTTVKRFVQKKDSTFFTLYQHNHKTYLRINFVIWKSMFDYVMNPTIQHITKLLNEPKLIRNCLYLCIVGGLSRSPYFQFRMRETFGSLSKYKLVMIVPKKPILCVVQGAAYFGITQNYIRCRILNKSYGVVTAIALGTALMLNLPKSFIEQNSYYNQHKQQQYVKNYFRVIARKNEEIISNTIKKHMVSRSTPNDMIVSISIVCSDKEDPMVVDENAMRIAELKVEFGNNKEFNMQTEIEFDFSETVIKVYAYSKNNPELRSEMELKYA